eukprot:gene5079-6322_t
MDNSPITQVQKPGPNNNLSHSSSSLITNQSTNNYSNKSTKGVDVDGANKTHHHSNKQELQTHHTSSTNLEALLGPIQPKNIGKKTLVLDLDETLVHSSFQPVNNADFIVPVDIEGKIHQVYVVKRPGVDHFLKTVGELFEIVVFTASLAKYADPVLNLLDIYNVIHFRLFREACHNHKSLYVKDLSRLGRELKSTIIVDNSPSSYMFHPENAIPIDSWFNDENDRELLEMIPLLEDITKVDDVRLVLDSSRQKKSKMYGSQQSY